jgi:hypothetical protein
MRFQSTERFYCRSPRPHARNPARNSFAKGALQNHICGFESYMPSQAMRSHALTAAGSSCQPCVARPGRDARAPDQRGGDLIRLTSRQSYAQWHHRVFERNAVATAQHSDSCRRYSGVAPAVTALRFQRFSRPRRASPRNAAESDFARAKLGCESARGPDADRHAKVLIIIRLRGSTFDAWSHGWEIDSARITPSPLYLGIDATSLFKSSTGRVGFLQNQAEG